LQERQDVSRIPFDPILRLEKKKEIFWIIELSVYIVRGLDVIRRHLFIKLASEGKRGDHWSEGQGSER